MHTHCTNGSGRLATKQTIDNTHINGMRRYEFHRKKNTKQPVRAWSLHEEINEFIE